MHAWIRRRVGGASEMHQKEAQQKHTTEAVMLPRDYGDSCDSGQRRQLPAQETPVPPGRSAIPCCRLDFGCGVDRRHNIFSCPAGVQNNFAPHLPSLQLAGLRWTAGPSTTPIHQLPVHCCCPPLPPPPFHADSEFHINHPSRPPSSLLLHYLPHHPTSSILPLAILSSSISPSLLCDLLHLIHQTLC